MSDAIDEIHVALTDMTSQVLSQATKLRPAIFPSYLQIDSIFDLCVTKAQRESAQNWLTNKAGNNSDTGFVTTIDYPHRHISIKEVKIIDSTDEVLYSVDRVMQSLVTGSESEASVYVNRFLTGNGYDSAVMATHKHVFTEVYNLSYAIKVLISNVSGFTTFLGEHQLPLNPEDDIAELLDSIYITARSQGSDAAGKELATAMKRGGNDDSEDDEEEEVEERNTKKRKHKRGGKKR